MYGSRKVVGALAFSATCAVAACSSSSSGAASSTSTPNSTPHATQATPPATTATAAGAYVWGSPLVITERTLEYFGHLIGVNHLFSQAQLSNASSRSVVAPNVDTLYSIAVIDLRDGPVVLHVPRIASQYWTYQFIDAWTDSFAYIGTRATHGLAGTWVVAPSSWHGTLPAGAERITSPTPQLFLLGRWFPAGDADVPRLGAALRSVTLAPLSPTQTTPTIPQAPGRAQDVPAAGARFYDELGDALAMNGPVSTADRQALTRFAALGVGPGKHPASSATPAKLRTLASGVTTGAQRVTAAAGHIATPVNGWSIPLDIGTYTDVLVRAATAQVGWGANVAAEALYAHAIGDQHGQAFDGHNTYRIHFAAGQSPPVHAFWSLTLYGPDHFLVANRLNRFAISTRTPGFTLAADGSFDIWIGSTPPASGESNWLPAPSGPFLLTLRMYLPDPSVARGTYKLPRVQRVGA